MASCCVINPHDHFKYSEQKEQIIVTPYREKYLKKSCCTIPNIDTRLEFIKNITGWECSKLFYSSDSIYKPFKISKDYTFISGIFRMIFKTCIRNLKIKASIDLYHTIDDNFELEDIDCFDSTVKSYYHLNDIMIVYIFNDICCNEQVVVLYDLKSSCSVMLSNSNIKFVSNDIEYFNSDNRQYLLKYDTDMNDIQYESCCEDKHLYYKKSGIKEWKVCYRCTEIESIYNNDGESVKIVQAGLFPNMKNRVFGSNTYTERTKNGKTTRTVTDKNGKVYEDINGNIVLDVMTDQYPM